MRDRTKITKRVVDGLPVGAAIWDTEVRGFGVRRQKSSKTYALKARIGGRQRWITIGEHGSPWTPESARREAQLLWGNIRAGVDVAALRDKRHDRERVRDLCERYLSEHARPHKKTSSVRMDERNMANHILPLLGDLFVEDVSRAEIDRFKLIVGQGAHASAEGKRRTGYRGGAIMTGGTGAANRCLALLSKMFNLAEQWELRPDNSNPVRHVKKYAENRKERYL